MCEICCYDLFNCVLSHINRFEMVSFSCFLVNSADRIIRVYESGEVLACGKDGEPEPIQKLQDLVNRFHFHSTIFIIYL
jgi:hypothetical protein